MAEKTTRNNPLDAAGIRLAPTPINAESVAALPSVRQEFVIQPRLEVESSDNASKPATVSTEHDFQPKKKDISKRWKRRRVSVNVALGIVMFILSSVILLQYILGAFPKVVDKLNTENFMLLPEQFGAVNNIVSTINLCSKAGWTSDAAKMAWLYCVPSLILLVGLIGVFVNFIKSITGMCGVIKPRRYFVPALIYLLMVLALLVMCLVGAPSVGVEQIEFVSIFKGYKTSEMFSILVFSLGYFLVSVICSWIASEKYGYLK